MLIFDIETEPAPLDVLKRIMPPFDPDTIPHPGEFDPGSVKTGNMKDAAKIAEKVNAAKLAHQQAVKNHSLDVIAAEDAYWAGIQEKAALNATTGCVVAIGYMNESGKTIIHHALDMSEEGILMNFWELFSKCYKSDRQLVGFNSNNFDVPFIARRTWAYGRKIPRNFVTPTGYLCQTFVDLLQLYQCGNRRDWVSLDQVCRAYGLQGKPDDCSGADFARLLRGTEEEKQAAINYLLGDLQMTSGLASRMGVLAAA